MEAKKAGEDPCIWDKVKDFLKKAGATEAKEKETKDYVELILFYEQLFADKSLLDKNAKNKKILKSENGDCHWVTIDSKHVCIENE